MSLSELAEIWSRQLFILQNQFATNNEYETLIFAYQPATILDIAMLIFSFFTIRSIPFIGLKCLFCLRNNIFSHKIHILTIHSLFPRKSIFLILWKSKRHICTYIKKIAIFYNWYAHKYRMNVCGCAEQTVIYSTIPC